MSPNSSNNDGLKRLLGGSPGSVLMKFVILSVIVGAFLAWSGLTPMAVWRSIQHIFEDLFGFGFDAVRNVFQYFLYGAMIVGPIWLLTRLLSKR